MENRPNLKNTYCNLRDKCKHLNFVGNPVPEIRELHRLKPMICDIFHSMFYCVQVLYTTNQQTYVIRDI